MTRPDGGRDRWVDLVRAVALVLVVVAQASGWMWLATAVPAGVLFALSGSLMVSSLRRRAALDVIGHRLRRVLPPLWLFGLVAVPALLLVAGAPVAAPTPAELGAWLLPLVDVPTLPGSPDVGTGFWFLRTYLWFVLLTPPMLWLIRRAPLVAVALPLAIVGVDTLLGSPLRVSRARPVAPSSARRRSAPAGCSASPTARGRCGG